MAMQRKPISPSELMRWAGETARANGSRLNPTDLRSWLAGFNARVLKKYSINLETVQPQQLLKQRAGVLKSGVVNFQATVATLLEEEPSSKSGVSVQQVTGTR